MKMNKIFRNQAGFGRTGIIIAVVVVVAVVAVFFTLRLQKEEAMKIGAVLTLSGPGEPYGKEIRDAMLLAVDEVNSWGGINGRKIELIIEDSKTDPEEGKDVFNKIETKHHPGLYISITSFISVALAPLAEEKEVVLVGIMASAPEVTEGREWVFKYYPIAETEAAPVLLILEKLHIKDLGIMYSSEAYGTSASEALKEGFKKTGGAVKSVALGMKEVDFREQIAKLKDVEAIYIAGYEHHFENALKQLKEANFRGDIIISSGARVSSITGLPEANGAYIAAPIVYDPNFLFAKELKDKYEARYNKPFSHFAANGYDFIKLLAGLLEDRELSRESIKTFLEDGFIYSGVFGSLDVKPGEHNFAFPLHPARIVDGKIKFLR
jgi:branched-chain amino acid transport system substrate-binding protein